jgi:hypothetical protein
MGSARVEQRGARWLALERQEIGAAPDGQESKDSGAISQAEITPPRYPLPDLMTDRALVRWWLVVREFGLG